MISEHARECKGPWSELTIGVPLVAFAYISAVLYDKSEDCPDGGGGNC